MRDRTGSISLFEEARDELRDRMVEHMESMRADVIDQPMGGEKLNREQRLERFGQRAQDDAEAEAFLDELDTFDNLTDFAADPQRWQPSRLLRAYLRNRRRDMRRANHGI